MSKTTKFPDIESIEERTAEWLAAIDRGLTDTEQSGLQNWLAESPLHGEKLVHFASTWDLMDLVAPVAKLLPLGERVDYFQLEAQKPRSDFAFEPRRPVVGWLPATGVLAGLAIMFLVILIFPTPVDTSFTSVYRTEVGETSDVMLPDGSRLELNTNTEVSVHINETLRRVVMIRGEAYFDVAKNPHAPFVAEVGETHVVAVGTAFNIELLGANSLEVLVTEGRVLVDQLGAEEVREPMDAKAMTEGFKSLSDSDFLLSVGEKARVEHDHPKTVELAKPADMESDLAWREGMLIFEGESLEDAISEINRYTSLDLEIVDDSIRNIEVGGYFRAGDTDELLVILENNFGIGSERYGDRLLLSSTLR